MRLGLHYHIPAHIRHDGIHTPAHFGRFIDGLARHCGQVTCFLHSPRNAEIHLLDYALQGKNISLVNIGPHDSALRRTLFSQRYVNPIRARRLTLDVMMVRGPSPLLPSIVRAVQPTPTVLLLVGDYLAGVDDLPQPRWRKEAIRLWAYWNNRGQLRAAQKSLTFVNSRKLFDEMKPLALPLIETRTTTLTSADFYHREDTCREKPYHILYAGRLDRGKGLLVIGEAIAKLVAGGRDVHFELAGWQEPGDPILDELQELASQNGFGDRLHYLGYKKVGTELFTCYRNADIFVNASLASEGFPRTIWEAMANSLPVVATRVGSIPHYAEGAVELIPPRDADALAERISALLDDPGRRRELIKKGMLLAQQNTLEVQSEKMVAGIRAWLDDTQQR